jgi:protoheme IX farnesyltransferase
MTVTVARAEPSIAGVGDYIELMKPRVMSLVVFTALVGLVLAPAPMHPVMAFTALLCITIGAGAAGALNMWYDADIDARMGRTAGRPVPRGRISPGAGAAMVALAIRVYGETRGHTASKQMFGFSILYLFLLFAMLLVDRMAGGLWTPLWGHLPAGA